MRRSLTWIAAAALAAAAAATGSGFAAETGSPAVRVTGGGSARVVVARPGMTLPHDGAQAQLSVAAGIPGQVSSAGDLFLVDTTGVPDARHASLYVTNLAPVAASLRGFAMPIGLWTEQGGAWRRADGVDRYLTSSGGDLELTLDPGRLYAVSVEQGGSWIGGDGAPVAPQFYLALA